MPVLQKSANPEGMALAKGELAVRRRHLKRVKTPSVLQYSKAYPPFPRKGQGMLRHVSNSLEEIDRRIISVAPDLELLIRERSAARYELVPHAESDAALVAWAGGTLAVHFTDPMVIFSNTPDE